jgi:hypothetical protein
MNKTTTGRISERWQTPRTMKRKLALRLLAFGFGNQKRNHGD